MNFDLFWSVVCIFGIAILFYGPWQTVCTDYARQVLFEKRDAIFDMAMRGEIDFRSQEYRLSRQSLEKIIRFAHELTLPRFLIYRWYLHRANLLEGKSELVSAIGEITDEETRAKVSRLVYEAQMAMLLMMFAKSPLTVLFSLAIAAASHFRLDGPAGRIERWSQPYGDTIQREAEYARFRPSASA